VYRAAMSIRISSFVANTTIMISGLCPTFARCPIDALDSAALHESRIRYIKRSLA
jgi:hypothetical protein